MKRWRYLLAARTSVHEVVAVAPLMQLLPLPPPVVVLAVSAIANDADAFWLMAQVNNRVLYKLLSHPKWKSDSGGSGKEERREKRDQSVTFKGQRSVAWIKGLHDWFCSSFHKRVINECLMFRSSHRRMLFRICEEGDEGMLLLQVQKQFLSLISKWGRKCPATSVGRDF